MSASNWRAMHSFTRDRAITHQQLKPGTIRRIASYARPYRLWLILFLFMTSLDAVVTVAIPLLLRELIDKGILPKDTGIVLAVAGAVAGLAIFDALLSIGQRWFSSRIGEGLIYDLRTQVFRHVQRQPIAFFTRAQTGSLVSRLNSDVIGAQQALTSTLSSVVSNVLSLILVLAVMISLSWLVTVVALVLLPMFVVMVPGEVVPSPQLIVAVNWFALAEGPGSVKVATAPLNGAPSVAATVRAVAANEASAI